jgi:hypothetical protein
VSQFQTLAWHQPHDNLTASQPAGRLVEMQLILFLAQRAQLFLPMSRVWALECSGQWVVFVARTRSMGTGQVRNASGTKPGALRTSEARTGSELSQTTLHVTENLLTVMAKTLLSTVSGPPSMP